MNPRLPWLLCLSACSAESYSEWPDVPPDTRAIVVGAEDELQARAWDPGAVLELPLSSPDSQLTLLAYDQSLDEMGLDEGPLMRATPTDCADRSLVPAQAIFVRTLSSEGWTTSEAPTDVASFRAVARCPCRALSPRWTTEIPGAFGRQAQAVVVDDTLYVVGTRTHAVATWILPLTEGSTGTTRIPGVFAGTRLSGSWAAPDGAIWLIGHDVVRWDVDTAVGEVIYEPIEEARGIDGGDQPFEIFVSETDGLVERFDGTRWETVYTPDMKSLAASQSGALIRSAPGRAIVAMHGQRKVLFHDDDREPIVIDREDGFGITALSPTPWTDALAGSSTGEFARIDGFQIVPIRRVHETPGTGEVNAIVEFGEAVFYTTSNGWVGEVREDTGVCVPRLLGDYAHIIGAARHGDDLVVVGNTRSGVVRVEVMALR